MHLGGLHRGRGLRRVVFGVRLCGASAAAGWTVTAREKSYLLAENLDLTEHQRREIEAAIDEFAEDFAGPLRLALVDVIPPGRSKSTFCWCDSSHDIVRYDHQRKCKTANAVLQLAKFT
jgi:hypothetical protein